MANAHTEALWTLAGAPDPWLAPAIQFDLTEPTVAESIDARHFIIDPVDGIFRRGFIGYTALYDQMLEDLQRVLYKGDPWMARYRIEEIIQEYQPLIGRTLAETVIASHLLGAHQVAQKVPLSRTVDAMRPPPVPPSGPLIFPEQDEPEPLVEFPIIDVAARNLYHRRLVMPWEFEQLSREARRGAFKVADVASLDTLGQIRDALGETVGQGGTLRSFRRLIPEVMAETALSPARWENIMRTNVHTALSSGQEAVLNHPGVTTLFPWIRVAPIFDLRLCKLCRLLAQSGLRDYNGQPTGIYYRDDPEWRRFAPSPFHWQCRCTVLAFSVEDAARWGVPDAIYWLDNGEPPMRKTFVPQINAELPRGWRSLS